MKLQRTPRNLETALTIGLLIVVLVNGEGGCRSLDFLNCVANKTLEDHVITSFQVLAPGLGDCQRKCFLEANCVSYNLSPMEGFVRTCELNGADHWMWPQHVVQKDDFEYCPIKSHCMSSPCPSNKICIPDFAWDNFICADGIWTPWSSWSACHDLPDCPRNRTRDCTNPATPQNIGTNCTGSALDLDSKECQVPPVDITACENPLGMEDGTILDSQITASSSRLNWQPYRPQNARLNNQVQKNGQYYISHGVWVPGGNLTGEYIQIDLGEVKKVTKIATQGRPITSKNNWLTKYHVSYSNNTISWMWYYGDCVKTFPANFDRDTAVTNKLEIPITARHIRVTVHEWHGFPALRLELYGCTLL